MAEHRSPSHHKGYPTRSYRRRFFGQGKGEGKDSASGTDDFGDLDHPPWVADRATLSGREEEASADCFADCVHFGS